MTLGTITLGERTFELRLFTLRENARAYPLARQLVADGVVDRWIEAIDGAVASLQAIERGERLPGAPSAWVISEEEMGQMADLVFMACVAVDSALTRDEFDALPVSPRDLFDAFIQARYCTGAWLRPDPKEVVDEPAGEGDGATAPLQPKSTSGESSPV